MESTALRGTAAVNTSLAIDNAKWVAAAAMVVDHINKYLLGGQVDWMYATGRIAFPIFAGVLGYKLAKCGSQGRKRVMARLLAAGALSLPAYVGLGRGTLAQGWWPLSVIWTLFLVAALTGLSDWLRRRAMRVAIGAPLFLLGGALGEFWWPGVGIGMSAWALTKQPRSIGALCGLAMSVLGLCWINGNAWALLAVPIALAVMRLPPLPRWQWGFYAFYPAHLCALWLWRTFVST